MRRLTFALLLAAVGLTACNEDLLTTRTPVLFASDLEGLPAARDGVWAADGCRPDAGLDLPSWDCDEVFIVRRGRLAHPDEAVADDPALMKAIRASIAPDFQIAQTGPSDPGDGYFSYHGIDGIRVDEAGRMIALRSWRLKCGPPPPDGTKTEGGKPRRQTLEPYPGVAVEEGGCAALGRAGLIQAASASRIDPKSNHRNAEGWRWVRDERPDDWPEARPVASGADTAG